MMTALTGILRGVLVATAMAMPFVSALAQDTPYRGPGDLPPRPQRDQETKEIPPGVTAPPSLDPQQKPKGLSGAPLACPVGYVPSRTALQNAHLVICEVPETGITRCSSLPRTYACGRGGNECCKEGTANRCPTGSYACSTNGSSSVVNLRACCPSS